MPQRMSDPPLSVGGQEQQLTEAAGAARLSPNRRAVHSPVADAASRGSLAEGGVALTERSWWREAFSRKTWTIAAVGHLLLISAVVLLCSWLSIVLSHQSEGVATIWLSNGILFGVVITRPRQQWIGYFIAGLTADTMADVLYGDPFRVAFGVSLANSVEIILSALLLTRLFGTPFNLSKRRPLIGFLLVSVCGVAALSSVLGALWTVHIYGGISSWQMWRTWYLGDMLGMALLAPLVFMLQRPGFFSILRLPELPQTVLTLLVPALVTLLVFTHDTDPLSFFIFPALLLVVFRLGFPGTVLTIFVVAFISIGLTVKGHGPLMLIPGEHMMLRRIVVAQIFLAVAIFTTFPVAALLEEREALQGALAESEARHRHLANADDLTGLWNRRAFNLRLEEEWQRAGREGTSVALLLLDVDLFKSYNDLYGHLGGDECLRSLAGIIGRTIKNEKGIAARFGGEEFAVILPREGVEGARAVAEQIRRAVEESAFPHESSPVGVQTVSLGVAALAPSVEGTVTELVRVADGALYRAKNLGRNRVVAAGSGGLGQGRDQTA